MKNGTNQAILLRDLLGGEGPYPSLADDFLDRRCSRCRGRVDDEARFYDRSYLCPECWRRVVAP
jgi:hypothetical protein